MRKQILLLTGLGCLLYTVVSLFAVPTPIDTEKKRQDSLRAVRAGKLASFRQSHPELTVSIDEVTGAPVQLFGDLSKGITQTDPVEIAYQFFEQNKDLYDVLNPRLELRVKGVKNFDPKMGGGTAVFLEQVYNGIKVIQSDFSLNINSAGKLDGVVGRFLPGINLSPTPATDSLSAIGIAKRDLNYTTEEENHAMEVFKSLGFEGKRPTSATLMVTNYKSQYHLIWLTGLYREKLGETWEYCIDAHSGVILWKRETSVRDFVPSRGGAPQKPQMPLKDSLPTPEPKLAPEQEAPILPAKPVGQPKSFNAPLETLPVLSSLPNDIASIQTVPTGIDKSPFAP